MSVRRVTRSSVAVMESISKDPAQAESPGEDVMETPESDSDSGNSLFLTQSVTSASRNVRRRRPSKTPERPLTKRTSTRKAATKPCGMATEDHVSDVETDLLPRRKSPKKTNSSIDRQPRIRRRIMPAKKMELPFLKTSSSGQLSIYKNQTIANSETGGFFKCVLKLNSGHKGRRRRELSPSILTSESEPNNMEASEDDEDIRKVDLDCFILSTQGRNKQNWLPSLKWKTGKCPEKSNHCQEEQEKCYQTKKVAEGIMEPQEDPDIDTEGSSTGEESRKPPARSFVSPHSSPSCLSRDNSPFVQSLFVKHQEEHSENKPQVLVPDSQSQYSDWHTSLRRPRRPFWDINLLDWHQTQKIEQACENLMERVDELTEATQWPCWAEQDDDDDETQILVDREEDGVDKHQIQDENICEGVHHEPVENDDFSSVGGCFFSSQDLFQEPNNQASPFTEISVDNDNEVLKSHMLADVAGNDVKYNKTQKTQPSEIMSPSTGDTSQKRKEKDKETLGDRVEHACPSLPLENYTSGSRENDYSSPSKHVLMVQQEKKTETPLFIYDGPKFLKRKKSKKTKDPQISDNLANIQTDPGQNGDSVPPSDDTVKSTERKKVKNDGLLEEPVATLPHCFSFPEDSSASVQDSSVVCSSVSGAIDSGPSVQDSSVVYDSRGGFKPKKKRKKDKNDRLLEEPVETLPEISVAIDSGPSVQDSSVVCDSGGGFKPKKKRKKDKNDRLLEEPVETLPEISVAIDSGPSVQDSSVVCDSGGGFKSKKKRKKDKNDRLLEEPVETLPEISVAIDSGPSVQDSSVVYDSGGGFKPKKKRKKDKNDRLLEEPVETLPEISVAIASGPSVQDSSVVCDSGGGFKSKKKRKKDKNDRLLEEPVETLPEISVAIDSGPSVQDSSVVCDSGGGLKSKKKRKKDKNDRLLEEPVETLPEISVAIDLGPSVQDSSVVCDSGGGFKSKKKRKKDKNDRLLEEPVETLPEISVAIDSGPSVQDYSVVCAAAAESKPKKKRQKDKNDGLLEKLAETLPEISVAADSSLTGQDSSEVCAAVGKNKTKKKRKKEKKSELAPQEDHWINVEGAIRIPCQASAPLVSIAEETEQLTRTDLSSPSMAQEVKHLDISTLVKDLVQSGSHEPRKKRKKKAKERDSSPLISDEMVAPQCNEEFYSSHGTKTVKKKKQKSKKDYVGEEQVGEMATGSKNHEPLEKSPEIPASMEIQPGNNVDLKTNDSVTPRKKKKRKRQEVEDTVNVEAPSIESIEQVETPHMVQNSEQQAAEGDQVRKIKKKKKKKDRTHQEDVSKSPSVSLGIGLGDRTASNTLSTRNKAGGTGEDEGLGGSEPVKKKKKKKKIKELENDGSWSVSHGLVYLNDSRWHNAEETTVMKETSRSREKLKENPAPRNDANEKNKLEVAKGGSSESIQDVPQSEDTIQPKEKKKKKKKRQAETDLELYPKPVEHDACQESGSPLEPSETIPVEKKKKKKKNRKDPVDRVENEGLDVVPELIATEEPKDIVATSHAKKDSILFSDGELLINIKKKKKKKRVKDSDSDLGATLETEQVTVSGKSDQCLQSRSAKMKKDRKRDPM